MVIKQDLSNFKIVVFFLNQGLPITGGLKGFDGIISQKN